MKYWTQILRCGYIDFSKSCSMVETIKVPANVNFLNKWAGFELPRGIVNKGITGCGATTLAIEDEHKTVICSP